MKRLAERWRQLSPSGKRFAALFGTATVFFVLLYVLGIASFFFPRGADAQVVTIFVTEVVDAPTMVPEPTFGGEAIPTRVATLVATPTQGFVPPPVIPTASLPVFVTRTPTRPASTGTPSGTVTALPTTGPGTPTVTPQATTGAGTPTVTPTRSSGTVTPTAAGATPTATATGAATATPTRTVTPPATATATPTAVATPTRTATPGAQPKATGTAATSSQPTATPTTRP